MNIHFLHISAHHSRTEKETNKTDFYFVIFKHAILMFSLSLSLYKVYILERYLYTVTHFVLNGRQRTGNVKAALPIQC